MRKIWTNRLFWEWLGIVCLFMVFARDLNLHILLPVHIPCDVEKYGEICTIAKNGLPLFGGPWFWRPYRVVTGILFYLWLVAMWFYGRKVLMRKEGGF